PLPISPPPADAARWSPADDVPGPRPPAPTPALRRGRRAGARDADPAGGDRRRPRRPCVPLRRPPRRRQDHDGPAPRQGAQLRARCQPGAVQRVRELSRDRRGAGVRRARDRRRVAHGERLAQLKKVAQAEGIAVSADALALVAREADGSLRDAQSLLDQVLAAGGAVTDVQTVREILGAADRRLVLAVAEHVLASDGGACVRDLASLHAHGYDPQRFCRDLLDHFRNLTVLRVTGDAQLLAELPEAEAEALRVQAERRSADDLQRFFRLLLEADETLAAPARTVDPQLVLEMAVLRLATLPPLLPVDDILRRLEALGAGSPASDSAAPSGPERVAAPAGEGLWEQFLARVRDDKVSLYLALATGKLVGADDA